MKASNQEVNPIIYRARIARLATADSEAKPYIVPVVFAFDGERYYIPIDEKPKTSKMDKLRRVKNIEINPTVALLIDEYSEDWKKLLYVMVRGKAAIIGKEKDKGAAVDCKLLKIAHRLLYRKYPQYQHIDIGRLGIVIYPQKTIFWRMVPENHN